MLQIFARKAQQHVEDNKDGEVLASEFHRIMGDCVDLIRIRKESGFTAVSAPSSPTRPTAMVATSGSKRNHPTGHTSGGYASGQSSDRSLSPTSSDTSDDLTPPGLFVETDLDDDSIMHLRESFDIEHLSLIHI